ncbi:hypothetical protein BDZ90DRAFT_153140 [Jaminaea rosea]|uniref:Proteasome assembly chaperone 2 n=1 Tax=Jaminaea rosea TaxID=1569628 RepID=A0A316UZL4_9BASI|nr:hypothetical protein BDZ90DRAFT_153140 [Jaminaea rosea]PWN28615.1 hypothetical protein BDZ90DRAFT_153140 [Jaminaea rosea]
MTTSSSAALRFCPTTSASSSSRSFAGHTLILPTISSGSVPQLCVDLLVAHRPLSLSRVGSLDAGQDLIPFVGGSDGEAGISTALDVFSSSHGVTVVQQRSPVLRARRAGFARRMAAWAREEGFARVVVLSSLDAALRGDEELGSSGGMMHYMLDADGQEQKKLAKVLQLAGPAVSSNLLVGQGEAGGLSTSSPPQSRLPSSSAGLTSRYLSALSGPDSGSSSSPAIPSGALLLWAAEGDNRGDAHRMAHCVVDEVLPGLGSMGRAGPDAAQGSQEGKQELEEPQSWRGLYGNAYDQALFG